MTATLGKQCRCGASVQIGDRCQRCAGQQRKRADEQRDTAARRLYGAAWQRARLIWLREHPLCADPDRRHEQAVAAREVDHIVPHRGDADLFWDSANWQSLCTSCHARKTSREDGGFGNSEISRKSANMPEMVGII